jgi:hypothetical protein
MVDVKAGDRIELIKMGDDPEPIEPGAQGTVYAVTVFEGAFNIEVDWDNGRKLGLVSPPDRYRKL